MGALHSLPVAGRSQFRRAIDELEGEIVRLALVVTACGIAFIVLGAAYRVGRWALGGI